MVKHTNDGPACPLCEERLLQAHPDIADWFRNIVKPKHQDAHISWSFRGKEDQEKAFLDGKSKLHWPLSDHNKSDDQGNPCSLALDLFELDHNGQASWHWSFFRDIAGESLKNPVAVLWGGRWSKLGDFDHFSIGIEHHS